MKILVTGAAGFIGSHVADRFLADGHDVIGIDNFAPYYDPAVKRRNAAGAIRRGMRLYQADLCVADLLTICPQADIIVHCAAQPGIDAATPFADYLRNNIVATERLVAHAAGLEGLRLFVHVSTSSVYGARAVGPESSVPEPTSHYGVTKLAAEQLVLAACRERKLPACSLRLFSVYGPRERPEKLVPRLIHAIATRTAFPLYQGARTHQRSFTFVADVVDAVMAAAERPADVVGAIFNIGSPDAVTTGDIITMVERAMGRAVTIHDQPRRPGDQLATHANIALARRVLGYDPRVRLPEGIAAAVAWFADQRPSAHRKPAHAIAGG